MQEKFHIDSLINNFLRKSGGPRPPSLPGSAVPAFAYWYYFGAIKSNEGDNPTNNDSESFSDQRVL